MRPLTNAALANAAYSPPSHPAPGDKESLRVEMAASTQRWSAPESTHRLMMPSY